MYLARLAFGVRHFFLVMMLAVIGRPVLAGEMNLTEYFSPLLKADTLLDNTSQATAKLSMPGWIESSKENPKSFGLTFKTGSSEFVLQSVTLMLASGGVPSNFDSEVRVGLYEIPEGNFPPSMIPFYEKAQSKVSLTPTPTYVSVSLGLPRLKPDTWYAIAVSLPNGPMAKIMGYQVPDLAPTAFLGFQNGAPFWGDAQTGWKRLLNPYMWVQGWDVHSQTYLDVQKKLKVTLWFLALVLLVSVLFVGFRWFRD
jgi:hypothetical protein